MIKKLVSLVFILAVVLSLALIVGPPTAAKQSEPEYAPDHILVKFVDGVKFPNTQEIHMKCGGTAISAIPQIGVQVVAVPEGTVQAKVIAYQNQKDVEFAEPDGFYYAIGTPDDPYFSNQWGMTKISGTQAWDITTGSPDVKIAILDTGVDLNHEDLAKIVQTANFTTSSTVDDFYGHGTHCAGIATATTNNTLGVAGVSWQSTVMSGKVLGDNGSGAWSWVASGITWAADNGARVISMSLGGTGYSATVESAVNYAWNNGVVIVAAAGNSNMNSPFYPAYYINCIAVAATDSNDAKASFSNWGAGWVDVAAPGVNTYSTLPNHGSNLGSNYGSLSGTSMACPHVAGLAALVWSTPLGTDNVTVRQRIELYTDLITGSGNLWLYGRINAFNAVDPSAVPNPVPPKPTPPPIPIPPTVTTGEATDITETSAVLHGEVTNFGSATQVIATIFVGKVGEGTLCSHRDITLNQPGPFSMTITRDCDSSLNPGTKYRYQAGAHDINNYEWGWGDYGYFTTSGGPTPSPTPTVTPTPSPTPTPPPPDFSLTVSPSSRSVKSGVTTSYTVKLTAINGYSSPVTLSASVPDTITYDFSSNPVVPSGTSIFTVYTDATARGSYILTVKGTDANGIAHSDSVSLKTR